MFPKTGWLLRVGGDSLFSVYEATEKYADCDFFRLHWTKEREIMEGRHFYEELESLRDQAKIVDLSRTIAVGMPAWPTQPKYDSVVCESYETGGESFHCEIRMSEHTGTHIDSPKHFIPGGASIDRVSPCTLMGRAVVIHGESAGPKGSLPLQALLDFERENGPIKEKDVVLIRFGWEDLWDKGSGEEYLKDWPGLSGEAARYLADKGVAAVGCDTLALDTFGVSKYICHEILLGKGIPILENVCNLGQLPPICGVMGLFNKFKDGSASQLRLLAFTSKD